MGGAGHAEPQDVSGGLHLRRDGKSLMVVRQKMIQLIDSFGNFFWILNGKALCWQTNFTLEYLYTCFVLFGQDLTMQAG